MAIKTEAARPVSSGYVVSYAGLYLATIVSALIAVAIFWISSVQVAQQVGQSGCSAGVADNCLLASGVAAPVAGATIGLILAGLVLVVGYIFLAPFTVYFLLRVKGYKHALKTAEFLFLFNLAMPIIPALLIVGRGNQVNSALINGYVVLALLIAVIWVNLAVYLARKLAVR